MKLAASCLECDNNIKQNNPAAPVLNYPVSELYEIEIFGIEVTIGFVWNRQTTNADERKPQSELTQLHDSLSRVIECRTGESDCQLIEADVTAEIGNSTVSWSWLNDVLSYC